MFFWSYVYVGQFLLIVGSYLLGTLFGLELVTGKGFLWVGGCLRNIMLIFDQMAIYIYTCSGDFYLSAAVATCILFAEVFIYFQIFND